MIVQKKEELIKEIKKEVSRAMEEHETNQEADGRDAQKNCVNEYRVFSDIDLKGI